MDPVIIRKPGFSVIGYAIQTQTENSQNFVDISNFWQKIMENDLLKRIPAKSVSSPNLGICLDYEENGRFTYMIAFETDQNTEVPDDMVLREIPEAEYAVFTAKGKLPESIQNMVRYIYGEWLPNSRYEHAMTAEFEYYDERVTGDEHSEVDIYIPVKITT